MDTDTARKIAESLSETDSPWHKKASELIEACSTVLEDLEEDQAGDWEDKSCSAFVDSAVDILMDTIATLFDNKISEIEGYFLSEEELRQLREPEPGCEDAVTDAEDPEVLVEDEEPELAF
jgi:hypothetical protein